MKLRVVLAGMVLLVASVGFAQEVPVDDVKPVPTPTPTPTPLPTPTPRVTMKKKVTPTPTPKKLEAPKIEGMTITRSNGLLLGFSFQGNTPVLTFYDAKQKKLKVDLTKAIVRYDMKRKTGTDQSILGPAGDGFSLSGAKAIPPPHNLRFTILLFAEGTDQAAEVYTITYREASAGGSEN